jgi:ribonuclease HI
LAAQLNIDALQVFGDSKIVIDGLNSRGKLHAISLVSWKDRIKELTKSFSTINFSHIYQEQNKEANFLSKKAIQMQEGKYHIING